MANYLIEELPSGFFAIKTEEGKLIKSDISSEEEAEDYVTHELKGTFEYFNDEEFEQWDENGDDYDNGYSHSQQAWADRSDYARERLEAGDIDEEQAAEIRAGA